MIVCKRCVMDESDRQIVFDKDGFCNHCTDYLSMLKNQGASWDELRVQLNQVINDIKKAGEGKEYDCLIGISGGVDSTYLAHLVVKEFGLRPLALHLDNGWNSKLAVKNINNIIRKLDIDLHTHVIDWEEFKELQLAYLKASVIDIEVPTDQAIRAAMCNTAHEHGINYILRGYNRNTETIIPKSWTFYKVDTKNLLDIHKQFGKGSLNTYPLLGARKMKSFEKKGLKTFAPLNFMPYNDEEARRLIVDELGWVDYGGKHHESIFTRFYQGYILPVKFGVDKRKAHLSTAICNGTINREEALAMLLQPTYDPDLQKQDYEYVLKKLDLTHSQFEAIMSAKPRSHFEYKSELKSKIRKQLLDPRNPIYRFFKRRKGLS